MGSSKNITSKGKTRYLLFAMFLLLAVFTGISSAGAATIDVYIPVDQIFTQITKTVGIDDGFGYHLIPLDPSNPMPAGSFGSTHFFVLNGTTSNDIGPITYTHAGVYAYHIQSDPTVRKMHYTYDDGIYTVTVYVRNTATGLGAEMIAQTSDGAKVGAVEFFTGYEASPTDPALMVDPPVRKTVSGNPSKNGTFTFTLTAGDPTNPMPVGSVGGVKTMTIVGSGEKDFGTWSYSQPGVYYYHVAEVNNHENGYTYDTSIYTITDTVTDNNGQLMLARVVTNGANQQVTSYGYINTFKAAVTPTEGPKTGDYANPTQMIATMLVSAVTALGCVFFLIRQRRSESYLAIQA